MKEEEKFCRPGFQGDQYPGGGPPGTTQAPWAARSRRRNRGDRKRRSGWPLSCFPLVGGRRHEYITVKHEPEDHQQGITESNHRRGIGLEHVGHKEQNKDKEHRGD